LRFRTFVIPFGFTVLARSRRGVAASIRRPFAIAREARAAREQAIRSGAIQVEALRLEEGPFVPFDSQPLQAIQDALNEFGPVAFDVGILDAQQQRAALMSREKPIE
jgi:hypothetical protein